MFYITKFIYPERVTKIWRNLPVDLSFTYSKLRDFAIYDIFVVILECMNFLKDFWKKSNFPALFWAGYIYAKFCKSWNVFTDHWPYRAVKREKLYYSVVVPLFYSRDAVKEKAGKTLGLP